MSDFDPSKFNVNLPNIMSQIDSAQRVMDEARDREHQRQARNSGRFDAEDIFNHLMQRVKSFQAELDDEHEIGIQLANFGVAAQIHIRAIGYKNPNLIEFHGLNSSDQEVTLVQHMSQLNFLLVALKPIEEKPYRIGFR